MSFVEGMRSAGRVRLAIWPAARLDAQQRLGLRPGREVARRRRWRRCATRRSGGKGADKASRGALRTYQQEGVDWLWFATRLGLGACLADDMGLGKTIQVLALLLRGAARNAPGGSLLVVPASLLANWKAETERFTPSLKLLAAHPSQMPREKLELWRPTRPADWRAWTWC